MKIIETQYEGKTTNKNACDLCQETPPNNILVEKPNSYIQDGKMILSYRPKPLYICLECLVDDVEQQ